MMDAKLLGIGETTLYRKLKHCQQSSNRFSAYHHKFCSSYLPSSPESSIPQPYCSAAQGKDSMQTLETIHDYLLWHSDEIGQRILSSYPSLHSPDETPSPLVSGMLRTPYPAQTLAIMGIGKRRQLGRNANVIAECGAGKTLIPGEACWCTEPAGRSAG